MLEGGDNAIAIMNLPFSAQAIEAGMKSLGRTIDLLGPYQAGGAFVLRAWAQANPKVLESYLAGYVQSLRWVLDTAHRDEAIAILMEKRLLSRGLATRSYDLMIEPAFGFNPDAQFDAKGFDNVLALRQEIEGGPALSAADYLDLSYYERAITVLAGKQSRATAAEPALSLDHRIIRVSPVEPRELALGTSGLRRFRQCLFEIGARVNREFCEPGEHASLEEAWPSLELPEVDHVKTPPGRDG